MAIEEDKTNSGALLTLVFVSAFAMIAVTLAVTAIARDEMSKAQEEKQGPGAGQYHELRRSQLGALSSGTPIEQSMQNVVQGLARDPSSATPPVPSSAAAPAPAPERPGPVEQKSKPLAPKPASGQPSPVAPPTPAPPP